MLQIILQIILLFIFINVAVLLGGLEGWLGWGLNPLLGFGLVLVKVFLLLFLVKLLMTVLKISESFLLMGGLVLSILIIFGNSYYSDFQKAFYQKQAIGGVLEIKASELYLQKEIFKTPYLKIVDSGIGEIKILEKNLGKPDMPNVINYCYGEILNTAEPAVIVDYCLQKNRNNKVILESLQNKKEIVAQVLPRRAYFPELKAQQFTLTQKTFDDYYQKQRRDFLFFIGIVNGFGLVLSLIFLSFKFLSKNY
jgi:hypothetical protein